MSPAAQRLLHPCPASPVLTIRVHRARARYMSMAALYAGYATQSRIEWLYETLGSEPKSAGGAPVGSTGHRGAEQPGFGTPHRSLSDSMDSSISTRHENGPGTAGARQRRDVHRAGIEMSSCSREELPRLPLSRRAPPHRGTFAIAVRYCSPLHVKTPQQPAPANDGTHRPPRDG